MSKFVQLMDTQVAMLGNRVLLKVDKEEEVSKGGIVIPDTGKDQPQTATVIAVGPGSYEGNGEYSPMHVEVGDKVVFGKYAGSEITLDHEHYIAIREEDLIMVIGVREKPPEQPNQSEKQSG